MQETKIKRKGMMFVLSSPSGAGKTTLSRLLLEKDKNLVMSVSMTTRPKRKNEKEGVDYYFVDQKTFSRKIEEGAFLECARVFDNSYGTPEAPVREKMAAGVDVLFDIDWQGTQQLSAKCREDMVSVFILPPTLRELESRLNKRGQDSSDVINKRMAKATDEISHWYSYDYVIVNDDLNKSLEKVHAILMAERQKRIRQHGLTDFIKTLVK